MLVNLLPGLRELRAPLASGFVWLLTGWLIFAPRVPLASNAKGIWEDLYRLGEGVGRPGVLAAATFAAYIVGIFNERVAYLLVLGLESMRMKRSRKVAKAWPYDTLLLVATDTLVHRYW